jgi:hypothetical protein
VKEESAIDFCWWRKKFFFKFKMETWLVCRCLCACVCVCVCVNFRKWNNLLRWPNEFEISLFFYKRVYFRLFYVVIIRIVRTLNDINSFLARAEKTKFFPWFFSQNRLELNKGGVVGEDLAFILVFLSFFFQNFVHFFKSFPPSNDVTRYTSVFLVSSK